MKYKLLQYKENAYSNYWLTPTLFSLLAIVLAVFTIYLDHQRTAAWFQDIKLINLINFFGSESARVAISTIAAATITITSVAFSITVLTLSLASNQLGPRLLPNFMRQGRTQFVLGIFIATFIYSLFVLISIKTAPVIFIPHLSVMISLIFGVFSFFLLIYFIHYVCHAIEIDNILTYLANDLIHSIERQFKKINKKKENENNKNILSTEIDNPHVICGKESGYIQTIDHQKLFEIAKKKDLIIKILHFPGDYVFTNLPLAQISKTEIFDKALKKTMMNCFKIGVRRTSVQDIEFGFEQLVEIAVRALSPGVNNPYTAIGCIDRIAQCISILNSKAINPSVWHDDAGNVRLILKQPSYEDIIDTAFNRLRQQAKFDISVSLRLLEIIIDLFKIDLITPIKKVLCKQAIILFEDSKKQKINDYDKNAIKDRFQKIQSAYKEDN